MRHLSGLFSNLHEMEPLKILQGQCLLILFSPLIHGEKVLVEMSHPYNNLTVSPPDDSMWSFERENVHQGPWDGHGDIWFEMNNYKMNEHAGTHIDAPTHFNKHGWDPSEIPLDHLVDLPAVVIDITERAITDPHAQLLVADLEEWEKEHGRIPGRAAILVDSGWSVKYGTPAFTDIVRDDNGAITDMRFPSISPGAAQWLVDNRDIYVVGIDTTSIEWEPGYNYTTHRILLSQNIYAIENLANPQKLPASGARVTVMPIRIEGGSGAAARIYGTYDNEVSGSSIVTPNMFSTLLLVLIGVVCSR